MTMRPDNQESPFETDELMKNGTRTLAVVDQSTTPVTDPCAGLAHMCHLSMEGHDDEARWRGETMINNRAGTKR